MSAVLFDLGSVPESDTERRGRADAEQKQIVLAALSRHQQRDGSLSNAAVRAAAAQLGMHPVAVRRAVRRTGSRKARERFEFEDVHLDAYYAAHGNAVEAINICRERGFPVPSCARTFQRCIQRIDPALRAGAKEGWSGVVNRQGYLTRYIPYKAYSYAIDHSPTNVWLRPDDNHTEPYTLWETVVLDEATRFELVVSFTDGAPDTETTVTALAQAVRGYETDDKTWVGGKPDHVISDNGSDLKTSAVVQGLIEVGVKRQFSTVRTPTQNGRVERRHLSAQREFAARQPGYVSTDMNGRDQDLQRAYWRENPNELLTFDQYAALRIEEQQRYNAQRPHRSLNGLTPLQAWQADTRLVPRADEAALRLAMLARINRKISKGRIRLFKQDYFGPRAELAKMDGRTVEVRYMPGQPEQVEVFYQGEHVCTAVNADNLDRSAGAAIVNSRKKNRATFLSTTARAIEMRAERANKRLSDEGFTDDRPSVPEHGQTPWTGQQPEDKAPRPDGETAATTQSRQPRETTVAYPVVASLDDHAQLDEIMSHYKQQEDFE